MKIKDTLQRDPAVHPLVNQGQARISDSRNERTQAELGGELETFVCEGQYAEGIQKIVRSFLDNLGKTSQRGAWVSGFFGSGKSHLLKMLCHLWQDTRSRTEGADGDAELPAVTQLFTEDYMVLFLLHNTLGAWWAGKVLASKASLATSAPDEAALRAACKVGDIDWTYLRFVRDTAEDGTDGPWRPAAGLFEGWPKAAKELTVLDPCMGSGHFLVFALPILAAFRMAEEGLSQSAAVDAVLRDNLFGLEIDPRCTQIAAFNLAFAAWRKVGHRPLPQLNLACSGLAIGVTKAEWLKLAEKAVTAADPAAKRDLLGVEKNLLTVGLEERVKNGLEALYDLFAKAPWLGSLIDPRRAGGDIFREGFDKLEPVLASIMTAADTDDVREMAVAAQGMAKAAELLGRKFVLLATNVPYLGRMNQDEHLRKYCDATFPLSKHDLATCFFERCISLNTLSGTSAAVLPQNPFFLSRFEKFRIKILKTTTLKLFAKLGEHGFESNQAAGGFTVLGIFTHAKPQSTNMFGAIDASANRGEVPIYSEEKKIILRSDSRTLQLVNQERQLRNPGAAIVLGKISESELLERYATCLTGAHTLDINRFRIYFWDFPIIDEDWRLHASTPDGSHHFTGMKFVSANRNAGSAIADLVVSA